MTNLKEKPQTKKKPKCYNCRHAGANFKIDTLTHLHCEHPRYKEEDFINGKLSAWDTLRVFSDTCQDHKPKIKTNERKD